MSKLALINEIQTAVKMAATNTDIDNVKLSMYLDDLLANYEIMQRDELDLVMVGENYIRLYLECLKVENYSDTTLINYGYQLADFSKFLDGKSLLKVTTADVRAYLTYDSSLMQSTIATKLNRISAFYEWLIREEELVKNPCSKIKTPKTPKKVRTGLTIIELEQVRTVCHAPAKKYAQFHELDCVRKRALVEVLYSTACRLDELHKLDRDDIDWHTGGVIVTGKGNKQRRVYLSEKAMFYLQKYLDARTDDCEALFATIRNPIHRLDHSGIQYLIKTIAKAANINRPLHPHIFRHSFAQMALDGGMPLEDLQVYLGHESPTTTMRYAAVNENRKLEAFKKYHVQ